MNIYKERDLRNGCAGLFLYVLQSNGFESFFNGRLRRTIGKVIISHLGIFRQQFDIMEICVPSVLGQRKHPQGSSICLRSVRWRKTWPTR